MTQTHTWEEILRKSWPQVGSDLSESHIAQFAETMVSTIIEQAMAGMHIDPKDRIGTAAQIGAVLTTSIIGKRTAQQCIDRVRSYLEVVD
jgi:hypothetical protein